MKITKRQLRRIIKEEKVKVLREYGIGAPGQYGQGGSGGRDNWALILDKASQILGYDPELQEESDGNIVVIVDDAPLNAEPVSQDPDDIFGAFLSAFPDGEWIDDVTFSTGMML